MADEAPHHSRPRSWVVSRALFAATMTLIMCGAAHGQPLFNLYDLGDLGAIGGLTTGYSTGQAINNAGMVAGISITPDLYSVAFRTGPAGIGQGVGSLLGLDTEGHGINASGQVVGSLVTGQYPNYVGHAF